jgi:hypothetical protein
MTEMENRIVKCVYTLLPTLRLLRQASTSVIPASTSSASSAMLITALAPIFCVAHHSVRMPLHAPFAEVRIDAVLATEYGRDALRQSCDRAT